MNVATQHLKDIKSYRPRIIGIILGKGKLKSAMEKSSVQSLGLRMMASNEDLSILLGNIESGGT
jgi:hypothetical protein